MHVISAVLSHLLQQQGQHTQQNNECEKYEECPWLAASLHETLRVVAPNRFLELAAEPTIPCATVHSVAVYSRGVSVWYTYISILTMTNSNVILMSNRESKICCKNGKSEERREGRLFFFHDVYPKKEPGKQMCAFIQITLMYKSNFINISS
ncbi:hypothetical protein BO83DRAFT_84241 [Aspergillus eucalypticola CBS 122712]|uniref:Uncharacterized protein n=1 Tax=Aspergillus eucalypticola (strain CBS 122712 / IBT 29274) TaxID=1448314 RepID=A0A317WD20_ASPEC|nr:uncharacterized protein BO83DRAFT_84241 [Aspergillus eucalypticola CBS 122712]PWY84263.1 hypothetical protein BO83DRAFT_84241 [Aspergillus eucalypticola CBS 122712]